MKRAIILILSILVFLPLISSASSIKTNEYQADVIRVLDGDTVALKIYLGFGITLESHCRLDGVNSPELHGDTYTNAMESKKFVYSMVMGKRIKLLTMDDKRDKYGRVLGIIMVDGKNVNQMLLDKKLAIPMNPDGSAVKGLPVADDSLVNRAWWSKWWH
jgi:micrococcal nuclease